MSDTVDELAPSVSPEEAAAAAAFDAEIDSEIRQPAPREPEAKAPGEPQAKQQEPSGENAPRDFEAEAREMGWTSKEEWEAAGKDPSRHRDAQTFVELSDNDPAILRKRYAELKAQNEEFQRKTTAATKAQVERVKRDSEAQYKQEMDRLRQERDKLIRENAGNYEAIQQVNESYERATENVAKPLPDETAQWLASNPHFYTDPVFQAAAMSITERNANLPIAEQLALVDKTLAARFPEHYGTQPAPQPKTNGAPPANSRSIEGARIAPRQKSGFDEMPAEARAMYQTLKDDLGKDAPTKEAFAKDYHDG